MIRTWCAVGLVWTVVVYDISGIISIVANTVFGVIGSPGLLVVPAALTAMTYAAWRLRSRSRSQGLAEPPP